jgi:hypothetical protein
MMPNPFAYQAEKLSAARRNLMLPHPRGEEQSIASAFAEISLGFHEMDEDKLDDYARGWIEQIRELMSTESIKEAIPGEGLYTAKARDLKIHDRYLLSQTVDALAYWFRSYEHE